MDMAEKNNTEIPEINGFIELFLQLTPEGQRAYLDHLRRIAEKAPGTEH